jgi:hypothetical protein
MKQYGRHARSLDSSLTVVPVANRHTGRQLFVMAFFTRQGKRRLCVFLSFRDTYDPILYSYLKTFYVIHRVHCGLLRSRRNPWRSLRNGLHHKSKDIIVVSVAIATV